MREHVVQPGHILTGTLFSEPMRVETVRAHGPGVWEVGLVERLLIVCPANLAFQWQRELKEKFDETFLVLKGSDIRDQFGVNQWLEHKHVITSLDLAKRDEI